MINFRFTSEREAIEALIYIREKTGIKCPKCKVVKPHTFNEKRKSWFCLFCKKSETCLKARTVMHKSKLPVMIYLNLLLELTENPGALSIKELQRRVGHKYYHPIWRFFHKVGSVLNLSQQEQLLQNRNSASFIEDITLLTQYLGSKRKQTNLLKKNTIDHKPSSQEANTMEVTIKAIKTNLNRGTKKTESFYYFVDKLSENWKNLGLHKLKTLLKRGGKRSSLIEEAIDYQSNPPWGKFQTPNQKTSLKEKKQMEISINQLFTEIQRVHRKADGDYLNSFFAHQSIKFSTNTQNSNNLLESIFKKCFAMCWFESRLFIPPHLERMGYIKLHQLE